MRFRHLSVRGIYATKTTNRGWTKSVGRALDGRVGGRGSNFRIRPILRNESTAFALQTDGPSHGLDDQLKWRS